LRLVGDPVMAGIMLEAGVPSDGKVPITLGASHAFAGWRLFGEHHLRDALAAAGAAILAGLSFEDALAVFNDLQLPAGRFETHRASSGATIIYDAYNASPSSMRYALASFAEIPASRHVAVLGSMAELGPDALRHHEAVGAAAAKSGADLIYAGGDFAEAIAKGARDAGASADRVRVYADNASALESLRRTIAAGDCVLLKGSRVQHLEEILAGLLGSGALAS
jgi:UDP-N-acetylmuramoyl-tripeptide--D-alanyl-D-alanine ligase